MLEEKKNSSSSLTSIEIRPVNSGITGGGGGGGGVGRRRERDVSVRLDTRIHAQVLNGLV